MLDILLTHAIAHREGKPPFFFSRFNFQRMKEAGNTHYCFRCGGSHGFKLNAAGIIHNIQERDLGLLGRHTSACASCVIGNADKYTDVWTWLGSEIPKDFPFIVHVPSIS